MKFALTILSLLITVLCQAQPGKIAGRIISLKNGKAISLTAVLLKPVKKITYTDTKGDFLFDSIPNGKYIIEIMLLGYLPKQVIANLEKDSSFYTVIEYPDTCRYDANRNNKKCPVCHKKNMVIPIRYGLPYGEMDTENNYYAGCDVTMCDPTWYCKRDHFKF